MIHGSKPFNRILSWWGHFSLQGKMVLLMVLVGSLLWSILDHFQKQLIEELFQKHMLHMLQERAEDDRLNLSDHITLLQKTVLKQVDPAPLERFISEREKNGWNETMTGQEADHRRHPSWLEIKNDPHGILLPRFILLFDDQNRLRHHYHRTRDHLPAEVLSKVKPTEKPGDDHIMEILSVDDQAYLILGLFLLDDRREPRASLILVQPLDNRFLFTFQTRHHSNSIVVFTDGTTGKVMASSRPDLIPVGTPLSAMNARFVIEEKPFFENSGISSELFIQFASLIPRDELRAMSQTILEASRTFKLFAALALILTFALILFWISRRLTALSQTILSYARNNLQVSLTTYDEGDSLENLQRLFGRFTQEIQNSRLVLIKELHRRNQAELALQEHRDRLEETVRDRTAELEAEVKERRWIEQRLLFAQASVNYSQDALFWVTKDGRIHYTNPKACEYLGYNETELLTMGIADIDPHFTLEEWAELWQRLQVDDKVVLETIHQTREGEKIPVEMSATLGAHEGIQYNIAMVRDIRERRRMERERVLSHTVFQYSKEGIFITDDAGKILRTNPAIADICGYSAEEWKGVRPDFFITDPHQPGDYLDLWPRILGREEWSGEAWTRRKDGEIFPALVSVRSVRNAGGHDEGDGYIGILTDISARKRDEERLNHLANHDPLTGLANRNLFNETLRRAILKAKRYNRTFTLMAFDLDRFKPVNDTHGHQAGDHLLREVARRTQSCLRESDLVARLGGDEFALIIESQADDPGPSNEEIAKKLVETLGQPFFIKGTPVRTPCSLGIGSYPKNGDNAERLISHTDAASYQAKKEGGNTYRFHSDEMVPVPSKKKRAKKRKK